MKFKRLRALKGSTLTFKIPFSDEEMKALMRVVRKDITKGTGAPVARFDTTNDENNLICTLRADSSMRLGGTYRYEIAVQEQSNIRTVQYGFLEIL